MPCFTGVVIFQMTHIGITKLSAECLKKILKEAKNLTALTLGPRCELLTFKAIQRVHDLRDLTLKIATSQIIAFPQFFKRLSRIQRLKLTIQAGSRLALEPESQWGSNLIPILAKFFRYALKLPRLEHLVIRLEGCEDYYKILLKKIHKKKLPSFHIIVENLHTFPSSVKPFIPWTNYIDTLYFGPLSSDIPVNGQKILSFNSPESINAEEFAFIKGIDALKNFYIIRLEDTISEATECVKSLSALISQTKTLENLTFLFEAHARWDCFLMNELIKVMFESDYLENLQSLSCNINMNFQNPPYIPLPYNPRMKNLKSLHLTINHRAWIVNISYLVEGLKDMVSLEDLKFDYIFGDIVENRAQYTFHCMFPSVGLKSLKYFSLNCNGAFNERSMNELVDCIVGMTCLRSLFISPKVFTGLNQNKVKMLTENLHSKEDLETAEFSYKEEGSSVRTRMLMKRVGSEMTVSSKPYL